jgi:septum formation protein
MSAPESGRHRAERYARVMPALVLASTSPYRKGLLDRLRIPFETGAPRCDEEAEKRMGREPPALARHLAHAKAESLRGSHEGAYVLGGDQVAELDGAILDKPGSEETARAQLARLEGREHRLLTAICLVDPMGGVREHLDVHRLRMRSLDADAIARYVALDRPLDCCGSYRVESLGIALFERIDGEDFTAIEGIPLLALSAMLRAEGFRIP